MLLILMILAGADAPRPIARLLFQDGVALRWADVREGKTLSLGSVATVDGFPELDPAKQKLAQMAEAGGAVCVAVRDEEDGMRGSGWVLFGTGAKHTDHGDHGHWSYKAKPSVTASRIDGKQGNPAHLYEYGGLFWLANDKLAGYTRIDPAKGEPRFFKGGGGHITLAITEGKVGYGCWIDGGGPNKGRVDVTPLDGREGYSFRLPSAVIHGATACAGKVFFAPTDGVCWVEADLEAKRKEPKVHHIPVGKDGDKPRRTGAFAVHGNKVLFVTGKGPSAKLVVLDASAAEPKPVRVKLGGKEGTKPVTPVVAVVGKKVLAFVLHDGPDSEETLEVLDLGAEPKTVKLLKVGRSAVSGHYGHRSIAFDAERRYAFIASPGEGTILALSLKTLEPAGTWKVGGKPASLLAVGGRETTD